MDAEQSRIWDKFQAADSSPKQSDEKLSKEQAKFQRRAEKARIERIRKELYANQKSEKGGWKKVEKYEAPERDVTTKKGWKDFKRGLAVALIASILLTVGYITAKKYDALKSLMNKTGVSYSETQSTQNKSEIRVGGKTYTVEQTSPGQEVKTKGKGATRIESKRKTVERVEAASVVEKQPQIDIEENTQDQDLAAQIEAENIERAKQMEANLANEPGCTGSRQENNNIFSTPRFDQTAYQTTFNWEGLYKNGYVDGSQPVTMARYGCGIMSATSLLQTYGIEKLPRDFEGAKYKVGNWSEDGQYYGSCEDLMREIVAPNIPMENGVPRYGIESISMVDGHSNLDIKEWMKNALLEGKPVVVYVNANAKTGQGQCVNTSGTHYVLVNSISEDGMISVVDSNGGHVGDRFEKLKLDEFASFAEAAATLDEAPPQRTRAIEENTHIIEDDGMER